jgi:hypothetical protein
MQYKNIYKSLEKRRNNPVQLTGFAIHCASQALKQGLTYPDDVREKLFKAFIGGLPAYCQQYNLLLDNQNTAHRATKDFLKAANHLICKKSYNDNFINKITSAISNTTINAEHKYEWSYLPLENKKDYLNEIAFNFLRDFDKNCLIHDAQNKEPLIGIETRYDRNNGDETDAFYLPFTNKIYYIRWLACWDKDDNLDISATKKAFKLIKKQPNAIFEYDASAEEDHLQCNLSNKYLQLVTGIGDLQNAKGSLAHELCHYTVKNVFHLYKKNPELAEKAFCFTKIDFRLKTLSDVPYPDEDEFYYSNLEEILAYKIQDWVKSSLKQPELKAINAGFNPAP